jgi:hypothetical protein
VSPFGARRRGQRIVLLDRSTGRVREPGNRPVVATLPEDGEFAPGLQAYFATASRPENQPLREQLLNRGLQQPDGIEANLGAAIGKLRQQDA